MSLKERTTFSFQVDGDFALFTDPITKIGGEKFTYPVPTYQALKGIAESIYWKPTFQIVIDKVRIMKPIITEARDIRLMKYNRTGASDLARYTYLRDVSYQVQAHLEWNEQRVDLMKDRNANKHYAIMKRSIARGGRRDIFLGTRECQGFVEECRFGQGSGYYDDSDDRLFGTMLHGFDYPDETGEDYLGLRLWNVVMKKGIIEFPPPTDPQLHRRKLHELEAKKFTLDDIQSVDDTYEELLGGEDE
ncbi:type I-C CRISPR-associated protein Cas5 [Limosilactobacillus fermentum]|uniref:type I-C CRISPR-associated protein Cas5c n=1 Tax=Limosilactobacillus fermentum TaxID=1613 RepID=UPI001076B792|nr:type I-C CRISPR-associated protein Cas5c [Limosilactobacillus fermentum]TFZ15015.1 type I-C CRISPR-associated protein Cas5 [Limosilactobacillus fermentum]